MVENADWAAQSPEGTNGDQSNIRYMSSAKLVEKQKITQHTYNSNTSEKQTQDLRQHSFLITPYETSTKKSNKKQTKTQRLK